MKPRVFVTRKLPGKALDALAEKFELEVWGSEEPPSKQTIIEKSREAGGLVSLLSDEIDAEVFDAAPKLEIIAQYAVGYNNIGVAEATKRGIVVTNTPDVLTNATADFTFALLLSAARRVCEADNFVRQGGWSVAWNPQGEQAFLGLELNGKTLGVFGLGRIGFEVAKRARAFGMRIAYNDAEEKPYAKEVEARFASPEEIYREADFITLHLPYSEKLRHMIGARELALMKKTACLINTARGPLIDEKALYDALKNNRIACAALDVFEQEPTPAQNPLLSLPNVVVAPHIASATRETRERMAEMACANLTAFFEGRRPPNAVNPEVFATEKTKNL